MNPRTSKLMATVGFTAALSMAAALAWSFGWPRRSAPGPAAPVYPIEFQTSSLEFDLNPERNGVDRTVETAIDRLSPDLNNLSMMSSDKAQLTETLRKRLHLLLDPDFETWVALASQEGELPTEGRPDHSKYENFKKTWAQVGNVTRLAPLSSEGLQLREIRAGEPPALGVPDTMFMRTGDRGGHSAIYKDPPIGARCVEALVPVMIQPHRSDADRTPIRCKVAMRFYRESTSNRWKTCDLLMYLDKSAFGRQLSVPVY